MNLLKKIMRELFRSTFDFIHKLRDSFDPKLYYKNYRVSKIINGNAIYKGSNVSIFVVYQKGHIPFYVKNVINVLNALHVDIVVTVNEDIGQEHINWLINNSYLCIVRKNFGRDFGAYKDAIDILDLEKYQKLLLLNDSLLYFSKNLDMLFEYFINSPRMVVTLTENFEKHWHAQTHFIALDKKIFSSKKFKNFWNKYKPYNSRIHSIFNGEIKFSKDVLSTFAADREVFYGAAKVFDAYSAGDILIDGEDSTLLSLLSDTNGDNSFLIDFKNRRLRIRNDLEPRVLFELEKFAIMRSLAKAEKNNSSHSFGFLAPFVTNTCVIKRDLYFRETFSLAQISGALRKMNLDDVEAKDTIAILAQKGSISRSGAYVRLKAGLGIL